MNLFPSLLAHDLMTNRKHYISHDADLPRDHFGSLYTIFPDMNLDLADYEKIKIFFEEYTGNSIATYISHKGYKRLFCVDMEIAKILFVNWQKIRCRAIQGEVIMVGLPAKHAFNLAQTVS